MVTKNVGSSISELHPSHLANQSTISKNKKSEANRPPNRSESYTSDYNVNLSESALRNADQAKKALDIAKATSATRDDKIAHFKRLIENGQYQPISENIADGILKEAIRDRLSNEEI